MYVYLYNTCVCVYIYTHCGAKLSLNNVTAVSVYMYFFRFNPLRSLSVRVIPFYSFKIVLGPVSVWVRYKIYKSLLTAAECKSVAEYVTGNRDRVIGWCCVYIIILLCTAYFRKNGQPLKSSAPGQPERSIQFFLPIHNTIYRYFFQIRSDAEKKKGVKSSTFSKWIIEY